MGAGAVKASMQEGLDEDPGPATSSQPSTKAAPNANVTTMGSNNSSASCQACSVNFTLLKRKKPCSDCGRSHCSDCLQKEQTGRVTKRRCTKCRLLMSGSFTRKQLMEYTIRDLRYFMMRRKIPMKNCTEKVDLVEILMKNSNNLHYQQELADQQRHLVELEKRKQDHEAAFEAGTEHTRPSRTEQPQPSPSSIGDPETSNHRHSVTIEDITDDVSEEIQPSSDGDAIIEDVTMLEIPMERPVEVPTENPTEIPTERPSEIPTESSEQQQSSDPAPKTSTDNSQNMRKMTRLKDVKDLEHIESLTNRQLKEILAGCYVDYKGCCERFELIERVQRLWKEKNNERRSCSSSDGDLCKICMDAVIDCVLLDCGHMVACTQCGRQMSECPVCRQYVVRVIHVFKA